MNELVPPASPGAYANAPRRVVRNACVDEWYGRDDDVRRMRDELAERMGKAMQEYILHELLVIAGEVAGAIDEVLPAAEIVSRMAREAEQVLLELAGA